MVWNRLCLEKQTGRFVWLLWWNQGQVHLFRTASQHGHVQRKRWSGHHRIPISTDVSTQHTTTIHAKSCAGQRRTIHARVQKGDRKEAIQYTFCAGNTECHQRGWTIVLAIHVYLKQRIPNQPNEATHFHHPWIPSSPKDRSALCKFFGVKSVIFTFATNLHAILEFGNFGFAEVGHRVTGTIGYHGSFTTGSYGLEWQSERPCSRWQCP